MIPKVESFMLDSGAFSFMQNTSIDLDWDEYVDKYADFIVQNKTDLFFELDIDSVVGYDKVQMLRHRLEEKTKKRCIPVWHRNRGKEEFIKMCKSYPYVAIGGIVAGEIRKEEYKYFKWFIDTAHKEGAKIHGLGFTDLELLDKYHFDSVDSSSWLSGGRYGTIYSFTGKTLKFSRPPKGKRVAHYKKADDHNLKEWYKYQKYAKEHL